MSRFQIPQGNNLNEGTTSLPRQMILEAVETLELEVSRWRQANEKTSEEMENLRQENAQLRRQLENTKEERDAANRKIQTLDEELRRLVSEMHRYKESFESESRRVTELEELHRKRNAHDSEESLRLKDAFNRKAAELKVVCQERETIRVKLEKAMKQNLDDRSIELLHELESLKRELGSVRLSKDEISKTNATLLIDIKNLEGLLSDKELQLRNETMRHSLLTTQFNSLMEENASLKEKQHVKTMLRFCEKNQPSTSESSSTAFIFTDQEPEVTSASRQGLQISVLPFKTPSGDATERSGLRRMKSFSTSGFSYRSDDVIRNHSTVTRGKSWADSKKTSSGDGSQSGRNSMRRSSTVPDSIVSHQQSVTGDSGRSTSSNTLPLLFSPKSAKQCR